MPCLISGTVSVLGRAVAIIRAFSGLSVAVAISGRPLSSGSVGNLFDQQRHPKKMPQLIAMLSQFRDELLLNHLGLRR